MKNLKIANWMFLANWAWFIIYNQYFGWNWHAESAPEMICDWTSQAGFTIACVVYLWPLLGIYRVVVSWYDEAKKDAES